VAQGHPPTESPPTSPETPAKLIDGEISMEEDDPPRLDEDNSPLLNSDPSQMASVAQIEENILDTPV